MGRFYEACRRVNEQIEARCVTPMDVFKEKGDISVKVGVMIGMVGPDDPDDETKIRVLGEEARRRGYII